MPPMPCPLTLLVRLSRFLQTGDQSLLPTLPSADARSLLRVGFFRIWVLGALLDDQPDLHAEHVERVLKTSRQVPKVVDRKFCHVAKQQKRRRTSLRLQYVLDLRRPPPLHGRRVLVQNLLEPPVQHSRWNDARPPFPGPEGDGHELEHVIAMQRAHRDHGSASQHGKPRLYLFLNGRREVVGGVLGVDDEIHLVGRDDQRSSLADDRVGDGELLPLHVSSLRVEDEHGDVCQFHRPHRIQYREVLDLVGTFALRAPSYPGGVDDPYGPVLVQPWHGDGISREAGGLPRDDALRP
mmetsp:Transcript_7391/g.18330  ORF Transcript_7391/g.18330 Transcript_7391/m.18330 type:complete len:295 (-) Transcript_7391:1054-1938(-)